MTRSEFLMHVNELLELPAGTLTGEEKLEDLEGWDSLSMMSFMTLVNDHLGVKLSPRQFVNCETVDDLLELAKVAA